MSNREAAQAVKISPMSSTGLHRPAFSQKCLLLTRLREKNKKVREKINNVLTIIEAAGAAYGGSLAFPYKTQTPMTLLEDISPFIMIRHIFFHAYLVSKIFHFHGQLNKHI